MGGLKSWVCYVLIVVSGFVRILLPILNPPYSYPQGHFCPFIYGSEGVGISLLSPHIRTLYSLSSSLIPSLLLSLSLLFPSPSFPFLHLGS